MTPLPDNDRPTRLRRAETRAARALQALRFGQAVPEVPVRADDLVVLIDALETAGVALNRAATPAAP